MRKRILSTLLALCMVLSLLPGTAFTDDILESSTIQRTDEIPNPETVVVYSEDNSSSGNEGNWSWRLEDGILTIYGDGPMKDYTSSPWHTYEISKVVIENGITYIGNCAFLSCRNITDVTIPDSVTSIGHSAFYLCTSLTNITIPDGVTNIEEQTFWSCSSLTSVTIPDSVINIGDYAFTACSNLTSVTIPDNVTSIGGNAFNNCSSLISITIPNSVTSIGWRAFSGCSSLTSITIPNSVTSIEESVFYDCSSLSSITIPDSVTSIENLAFSGCSSLTSIAIPDSVTNIGVNAFSRCSSLSSITIPGSVTSIENYAFSDCSSLISITIPNSVTSIGMYAFSGCSSLTSITIPNSVTSIGESAFYVCSNLSSIMIPDSVTSIENYAFYGCSHLTAVYYAGSESQWEEIIIGSANDPLTSATIHYNSTGPDDIRSSVMLLSEWDAENQRVRFNTDIIYYSITDETDLPAESLGMLVGRYALVDSDDDTYSVRSIQAVDSALGTVNAITTSTITIDGKTYPLVADVPFPNAIVSREVLYHVLDGRVVSVGPLSWSVGILDNYNPLTGVITIDGEEHLTCFLTNLGVIDEYDLVGGKIGYAMHDRIVIQLDPDPVDPDLPDIDEFEVSIYRANSLIHPPYSDRMTSLKGFSSPSRILVSEFSKNYWWLASTSVWSTFTNIMDTASKPSNLYAIATAKRDYYEALIFDLLEVSTNYGYVDYAKDLISEAKSWNGEIQNIIGVKESLEDITALTSDQKSLLEKVVKTKFIESYSEVHKGDIGEPTEGLAVINEVFALSSSVLDIASSIEDYLEIMATSFALVRMEDSLKTVVRQMLASCPDDETALRDALRDIVKVMDATKEELFVQLMSKQAEIVGWNASKQLIDDFWSKGVLNCSPEVQALLKIYKTEKWLLNYVSGVDVDDIVEAGANVTNFVVFENLMLDVVSTLGGNFCSNKTTDTANAYLSAVDIMFATWLKSCFTAVSFEKSLKPEEQAGDGLIPYWINFMNSIRGESASTLSGAVENYKRDYISTYNAIWNGWIQKLNDDYPNSGLYEKYRDLLIDFSNKYEATSFVRKKVEVKCPVDVLVYDQSNNLVASVVAGDAWYNASVKDITVVVEGDAKTLYLYDNASYRIECVGTDTGSMDVIVTEYDDGSEVRNVYFYDLPLIDGKTFEMSVDDKILSDADYELDSRGETLEPDLDTYAETSEQYTLIVVSGAVSSDAEAVFEGKYYAGELIEVTALIDANQTFTGWTSNSSSVTFTDRTAKVTTFRMPAENVVVKAEISGRGYAIYLDGNGGTPESVVVATNLDGKLDAMPAAIYAGQTLVGWYTAKEGGEEVTTSTVFSEDTTIYAHWTQNITPPEPTVFTITFNANNGTVTPTTMTTNEEGKLAELPTPVRSGYSFAGWFTALTGGNQVTVNTVFTSDATVYARWAYNGGIHDGNNWYPPAGSTTPTTYRITVPAVSGGTVNVSPTSAKKGDTVTITATPDSGYELDYITVTERNGDNVPLTDRGNGKYVFTMPDGTVTLDCAFNLIKTDSTDQPAISFFDVVPGVYYYDAVAWAVAQGITNGTSATTFSPDAPCTRGQIVTFLWRAAGSPSVSGSNPFTDVQPGDYWYDAVLWAVSKGITTGTSATMFSPNDTCTRGQTVTFLYRNAGSPTVTTSATFTDVALDAYYSDAVAWALAKNITNGTAASMFSPQDQCTRGQIVTFLYRSLVE